MFRKRVRGAAEAAAAYGRRLRQRKRTNSTERGVAEEATCVAHRPKEKVSMRAGAWKFKVISGKGGGGGGKVNGTENALTKGRDYIRGGKYSYRTSNKMAEEVQDTSEIVEAPQTSLDIPEPSILLYVDRLRPPIGTSYFKRDTVTLLDNVAIQKDGRTYAKVTWSFNYYLYVTGARPDDPDFPKRGQVYIVFVHTGSIDVKSAAFDTLSLTLTTTSEHCTASLQLPETGSGEQVGTSNDYKYLMDFDQTMNMFKNNGNEAMDPPFDARYKKDFIAKDSKQRGTTREKSVEFGASNGVSDM
ncbi:hypothetical protein BDN71DRAFT_1427855 [Pleurotus eryngii]|uniref:Uncharacterized protein n=1 Tax=Pleurotus eryngii TaxID=5323 RepID=A0A9P6A8X2_PLEER|nr:hypothetical protein BDN71DRAFT_1427855 [Pleurotus eryngii]